MPKKYFKMNVYIIVKRLIVTKHINIVI